MAGPGWNKILTKIGNRAGSIVGIGAGADQLLDAKKAKQRAISATPGAVDPTQASFLAELQQKKNAINTGSEYTSSLDAVADNMAQTQDTLAGNSGGDAGGTVSALLKSQQVANRGEGQLLAQGQQSEGLYSGLYGNLLDKIAQRKMELGLLDRAQNMAEWAQKSQTGMANLTAGAQSMMDFKGSEQKAQNPLIPNSGTTPIGGSSADAGGSMMGGQTAQAGGGSMIGGQKKGVASKILSSIGQGKSQGTGAAALNGSAASQGPLGGGGGTPGAFSSVGGMDASKFGDILSTVGK